MKSLLQLIEEREKRVVMTFGRMNPPTAGHAKLVDKVHELAKQYHADHSVRLSHSQDPKKNPLTGEQKVEHAKRFFPNTNISSSSKESPSYMHHAAELHKQGYKHLIMVAGEDRKDEYEKQLNKYNGKFNDRGEGFHFKSIKVVSAGHRDPNATGVEGMSASKMRAHAQAGNFDEFKKGVPSHVKPEHVKKLYDDVRHGMHVAEEAEHDAFKRGTIYNKGDLVEDLLTGAVCPVEFRGSNYITIVTESGDIVKRFLKDVAQIDEDRYTDNWAKNKAAENKAKMPPKFKPFKWTPTPKAKIDHAKMAQHIDHAISMSVPDGDPYDHLADRYPGLHNSHDLYGHLDKAVKKHLGFKSYNDYVAHNWDGAAEVMPELHGRKNPWREEYVVESPMDMKKSDAKFASPMKMTLKKNPDGTMGRAAAGGMTTKNLTPTAAEGGPTTKPFKYEGSRRKMNFEEFLAETRRGETKATQPSYVKMSVKQADDAPKKYKNNLDADADALRAKIAGKKNHAVSVAKTADGFMLRHYIGKRISKELPYNAKGKRIAEDVEYDVLNEAPVVKHVFHDYGQWHAFHTKQGHKLQANSSSDNAVIKATDSKGNLRGKWRHWPRGEKGDFMGSHHFGVVYEEFYGDDAEALYEGITRAAVKLAQKGDFNKTNPELRNKYSKAAGIILGGRSGEMVTYAKGEGRSIQTHIMQALHQHGGDEGKNWARKLGYQAEETMKNFQDFTSPETVEVLDEKAPPGMEAMVKKLKNQYPGHQDKAFATAWSIYNKKNMKRAKGLAKKGMHAYEAYEPTEEDYIEACEDIEVEIFSLIAEDGTVYSILEGTFEEKEAEFAKLQAILPTIQLPEKATDEPTPKSALAEAVSRKHFQMVADTLKAIKDPAKRTELAHSHASAFAKQNPRFDHERFFKAAGVNVEHIKMESLKPELTVVEEGMDWEVGTTKSMQNALLSKHNGEQVSITTGPTSVHPYVANIGKMRIHYPWKDLAAVKNHVEGLCKEWVEDAAEQTVDVEPLKETSPISEDKRIAYKQYMADKVAAKKGNIGEAKEPSWAELHPHWNDRTDPKGKSPLMKKAAKLSAKLDKKEKKESYEPKDAVPGTYNAPSSEFDSNPGYVVGAHNINGKTVKVIRMGDTYAEVRVVVDHDDWKDFNGENMRFVGKAAALAAYRDAQSGLGKTPGDQASAAVTVEGFENYKGPGPFKGQIIEGKTIK